MDKVKAWTDSWHGQGTGMHSYIHDQKYFTNKFYYTFISSQLVSNNLHSFIHNFTLYFRVEPNKDQIQYHKLIIQFISSSDSIFNLLL